MKTTLKNILKDEKFYIITFLIATFIITVIYKLNHVTPLGGNSLLCVDFFHQYGPMLGELYDRIKGFDNLIYSFNMAMGLPFFRNFFNYLSSPFNIIMLLFSRNNLVTSYSFIIGLKAITSSVTFLYFMFHKFKKKEAYFIPLALLYAFSAYFSAYYWNIMWLDGMVMLPLITLGIEKIVDEGKYKLYLFSLSIMLFANYFIAYMICIFSVVYFILYIFNKTKPLSKNTQSKLLFKVEKGTIFVKNNKDNYETTELSKIYNKVKNILKNIDRKKLVIINSKGKVIKKITSANSIYELSLLEGEYKICEQDFIIDTFRDNCSFIFKKGFIFACSSILAAMLVSCFLLPMFSSLTSISATGGNMPTSQYYDFKPFDFLIGHLTGVKNTVFASDDVTIPNISCGILPVALLLLFIINPKIKLKTKMCYLFGFGFFLFAFFNPQLDYILHAFHVPNDLPYRYSFLYTFMLVLIGAYSIGKIKHLKFYIVTIVYILLMVGLGYLSFKSFLGIDTNMIYTNMILLSLYFIFYAGLHFQEGFKNLFYFSLIVVASVECIVSINYNWDITQILEVFYADYNQTEELLEKIEEDNNDKFYRVENTQMMTLNDSSWYNYHGFNTFTSMAYESLAKLEHNLGLPGNEINSYFYVQTTPIFDLMMNIKYIIGDSNDVVRYKEIASNEETANRFIYNVGLMFAVDKDIKSWEYSRKNPLEIQNNFMKLATGIDDALPPATLVSTTELYHDDNEIILKYTYENHFDNLYFYTDDPCVNYFVIGSAMYHINSNYSNARARAPEIKYSHSEKYDEKKVINIKSQDDVVDVYVSYSVFNSEATTVHEINQNNFLLAYDKLKSNKVDIKTFDEYKLSGSIFLEEDKVMYTSIPYDKSWQVLVDGKKVKTYKIGDALLAFDIDRGTHDITLKYTIPHLNISIPLTFIAIAIIIIDTKYRKNILKLLKIN